MKTIKRNTVGMGVPFTTRLMLVGIFLLIAIACSFTLIQTDLISHTVQKYAYSIGFSVLVSGLLVGVLYTTLPSQQTEAKRGPLYYPLLAGILGLLAMTISYIWLGVWPFGTESVMIVDMHHQYAPLLAQLRHMLLEGGSPLYTFETGIGANFISLFAYYLASPLNFILTLFPESLLTEGILVITLIKNAVSAMMFAACVQYVFRRRDISVVLLSLGYSLSMYMIAYSWNIMWLDGVMLLPLVVLGFERMMRERKYGVYVLTLAYILITNYYIGFMVCVFLVLYYVAYLFRHPEKGFITPTVRFAIASLIGGGMAMTILLPVVFALQYTSAAGQQLPEFSANFALLRVPAQQLFGMVPTIRSGNLPNIFCGVLPVVLVPLFLTTKTIPLRKRLGFGGLVAALWVSFTVNVFDLIWHGLHTPNDLPYRFSFLYVFAFLMCAAAMFPHMKDITPKQIGVTLAGIAAFICIYEALQGQEAQVFMPVYATLALAALYSIILLLLYYKKLILRTTYAMLTLVFVLEMVLHSGIALKALNGNEYYTDRSGYIANSEHASVVAAVQKMEELADAESGGAFYRAEFLPLRTCVDTALYHYRGLTSFSSSNYYHTTRMLDHMGYAANGVNSYLYHSFIPTNDSLLALKYVALQDDITSHPYLEKIGTSTYESSNYYIYRNNAALPIAYGVSAGIHTFSAQQYNPFATQESLWETMTGDNTKLFSYLPISVDDYSNSNATAYNSTHFTCVANSTSTFKADVTTSANYFIFIDCTAGQSANVTILDETGTYTDSYEAALNEAYIIDTGELKAGSTIKVDVSTETAVSGNIYIAALDKDVFDAKRQMLAKNGMTVTSFSDHYITGTVNTDKTMMFTSIPYDASWIVTVDGKPVETYPIGDIAEDGEQGAFLSFDIPLGQHTVTMRFVPKGLNIGLALTAVSILAFFILLIVSRHARVRAAATLAPKPAEHPAFTADDFSLDISDEPTFTEADQPSVKDILSAQPQERQVLSDDVTLQDLLGEPEENA